MVMDLDETIKHVEELYFVKFGENVAEVNFDTDFKESVTTYLQLLRDISKVCHKHKCYSIWGIMLPEIKDDRSEK